MKLGLIARADNSGLGVQTLEFYRHMQPAKTMVVDISKMNGNRIYTERYPDAQMVHGIPTAADIDRFLEGLDVVFVAEAPYNYHLYQRARELGVKTAVQYNYEFFDWFEHPDWPMPDMLIAPSKWHFAEINAWVNNTSLHGHPMSHVYLHCPVNRELLPYRKIDEARIFLHVAGRSAAHDRNGTETVIEASKHLTTNARIKIHFQGEQGLPHQATKSWADYVQYAHDNGDASKLLIYRSEYDNYQDVYREGDVLVLPRRYGGNCLPLNEALSVGMPVIMPDISPNSQFLPPNWLVPAEVVSQFTPRTTVDIYGADPVALAAKIDEFYNMSRHAMWFENLRADNLAYTIDWRTMKPQYEKVLGDLCSH